MKNNINLLHINNKLSFRFVIKQEIADLKKVSHFRNTKAQHKWTSKNAKHMRNTKRNCFSLLSASPRNDKQCFANQTNRCPAGFATRSELFRDSAHINKTSAK